MCRRCFPRLPSGYPSSAGTGTCGSSSSRCPRMPCCSGGSFKRLEGREPAVKTSRSQCRSILVMDALHMSFSPGPCHLHSFVFSRHFRYGAPPVINPLGYSFAPNTSVPHSFTQTMRFRNAMQSNLYLNISNPAPGDWFVAAHLPKDTEKIEIQGLTKSCTYVFQPELFVLREVDVPILQANLPMQQVLESIKNPARYKLFVPEYTQQLQIQLLNCTSNATGCPLVVTVGSVTQLDSSAHRVNCNEGSACGFVLQSPPWEKWLSITVEKPQWLNSSVSFQLVYNFSVCKPGSVGSRTFLSFLNLFSSSSFPNNSTVLKDTQQPTPGSAILLNDGPTSCLRKYPVIREDLDVVSVRFYPVTSPSVPVATRLPSVILLDLNSEMDSGGMLVVNLQINKTGASSANSTVLACLSPAAPVLTLNDSQNCTTAFSQGYSFSLSDGATSVTHNIPYPVTDRWYLSMQVLCPGDDR
ncbi:hypothetical protein GDO78_020797 [Eleutherodactylus coqui]|uniref:Transmembrane protein 8A n=1 Tax=Eleutherodactylus coqui TaxID=57060 RepID=A0A8J6BI53_ELECQ|nr:hypothetical protein GDO78_020797 [Eleutherodactylus coqui]